MDGFKPAASGVRSNCIANCVITIVHFQILTSMQFHLKCSKQKEVVCVRQWLYPFQNRACPKIMITLDEGQQSFYFETTSLIPISNQQFQFFSSSKCVTSNYAKMQSSEEQEQGGSNFVLIGGNFGIKKLASLTSILKSSCYLMSFENGF